MPKRFFNDYDKRRFLIRIAKGADFESLASDFGLTTKQIRKYTYNHKRELKAIEREIANDLLSEILPPLDRVKTILGSAFKMHQGRIFINKTPITIREAIRQANLKLTMEGKPQIFYPGLIEPSDNDL